MIKELLEMHGGKDGHGFGISYGRQVHSYTWSGYGKGGSGTGYAYGYNLSDGGGTGFRSIQLLGEQKSQSIDATAGLEVLDD